MRPMSSAAKIDFENYFALFAVSLERFSIPGLGSFVWHIERAEVDPKSAQIKPPRPQLKYEPGQRYLRETIAFLMDKYGLSEQEAEAFLKELGLVLVNYLKAANEMDVWKLGKLRRSGVSYRLELSEEAPLSFLEDLHPVSLRHTEGAVAPISGSGQPPAPPPAKKAEKERPTKESSRAKAVEVPPQPQASSASRRRGMGWIVAVLLLLVGIGVGAYFILRQREKTARQPVEIVLGSKNEKKPSEETPKSEKASEPPAAESKTPGSTQSSAPENKPPSKPSTPEKPSPPSTSKAPVPERATSPQPTLTTPQKGRYYIIVGSEPTLEEAYTKAKALGIPTAEFLPVPERGRVRISYHSTPNKAEAEARLKEVKARIPDAWLYTP
jgi:hypothetical protein